MRNSDLTLLAGYSYEISILGISHIQLVVNLRNIRFITHEFYAIFIRNDLFSTTISKGIKFS
jgi:hypothetical protein